MYMSFRMHCGYFNLIPVCNVFNYSNRVVEGILYRIQQSYIHEQNMNTSYIEQNLYNVQFRPIYFNLVQGAST